MSKYVGKALQVMEGYSILRVTSDKGFTSY